jgi:uncharacterized phage protein gp47/JayE
MPFARPSLGDIRRRVADDLINKLPGADTRLRVNNLRAFSEVEAGVAHLLYGRLEWSFRQLFPDTAEAEFLDRWASIWGVQRIPPAAAYGSGTWQAQPGARIAAGALLQRADNVRYMTRDGGSEENGSITVEIEAITLGAIGNAETDTQLNLLTTFAGVAVQGLVAAPGLAGGADQQTDQALLQAVLMRIQMPPHGGAAFDYVRWALEVPGVTRAWCYPLEMGVGTVTVRFMMDDVRANQDGIPTPADVAIVADYIDVRRPVTAKVYVAAPIPLPIDVVISALQPDTPAIRADIEENIRQMLLEEAEPEQPIYLSQWSTAIGITAGVERFVLDEPSAQTNPGIGEIAILQSVSYA